MRYVRISQSWVALHPAATGVVMFYGGEFFGLWPTIWYQSLLQACFDAGFTVIAVPVQVGLDHARIAAHLLRERDRVRAALPQLRGLPHCWAGHSVGCTILTLLEAATQPDNRVVLPGQAPDAELRGILDEPSLLLAPSFADTSQAIPWPWLARLLARLGLGVTPTKAQTQALIAQSRLFALAGLLSFHDDRIAGNDSENPQVSDVAWLLEILKQRQGEQLAHTELPGGHMQPAGLRIGRHVLVPTLYWPWQALPRQVEQDGVQMLRYLLGRRRVPGGER